MWGGVCIHECSGAVAPGDQKRATSPGAGVKVVVSHWRLNSGPLQEYYSLLPSKLSLQLREGIPNTSPSSTFEFGLCDHISHSSVIRKYQNVT